MKIKINYLLLGSLLVFILVMVYLFIFPGNMSGMRNKSEEVKNKKPWEAYCRLKADGHFLVYEDGTPFFYLGDTDLIEIET